MNIRSSPARAEGRCRPAFLALVLLALFPSAALHGATTDESAARTPPAAAAIPPSPTARDVEARREFLEMEAFTRLPEDQQAKGFAAFYRAHPLRSGSPMMILSSIPGDILNRKAPFHGGNPEEMYGKQLADAAATMTPEEVADNLGTSLWLNIASYSRQLRLYKSHEKELTSAVQADVESLDAAAFQRGCNAISELKLTAFTGQIVDIYIANGPRAKEARTVLIWLRSPEIAKRLRAEIERDPKTLIRHADLFEGPLAGEPADPLLLKYLSSDDVEMREAAARALSECKDPALATPVAAMANHRDARLREHAAYMADKLPDEAFASIRADFMPLLRATDPTIQNYAIKAFADHKDMAVAPVIRDMLASPPANPNGGYNVTVSQALHALAGDSFGYNFISWGPEKNAAAIARFDQWIRNHSQTGNSQTGNGLP